MVSPEEIYERISRLSRVEGIYDAWKDYRDQVTAYLTEHAPEGGSLLILGAGRLGDLDVPALLQHFESITLADLDPEAMREGLAYWGLQAEEVTENGEITGTDVEASDTEDSSVTTPGGFFDTGFSGEKKPKLTLRKVNLTGITKEHYIEWIQLILEGYDQKLDPEEFSERLEAYLKKVYGSTFRHDPHLGFCRYDHAAILGVHSQLNNTFAYLWMVLGDLLGPAPESVTERIFALIRSNTGVITDRVSRAVQQSAMESCFVGLEVERIGTEGPVDGAAQAFAGYAALHIEGEAELSDPVDLIWDYDKANHKSYRMRLMICS